MKMILHQEDWLYIAKNYEKLGPAKISSKLKVSRQRIEQIAVILRKNGVKIPRLRAKSYQKEFIGFVKKSL